MRYTKDQLQEGKIYKCKNQYILRYRDSGECDNVDGNSWYLGGFFHSLLDEMEDPTEFEIAHFEACEAQNKYVPKTEIKTQTYEIY